jgi:hypothetical protein
LCWKFQAKWWQKCVSFAPKDFSNVQGNMQPPFLCQTFGESTLCWWISIIILHTWRNVVPSLWKIRWFAIGIATRLLSYNDNLQFYCNLIYFYIMNVIGQITWITTNSTHCMWNCICMQLMQLQCNHFTTIIVISCWHCFSSIDLSMMNFVYFHCNCGSNGNTLMAITN